MPTSSRSGCGHRSPTGSAVGTLAVGERVFHAAVVPLDAAGTLFGFLLAGAPIDDAYASTLRESGRDDVVILSDAGVLASTLLRDRLPWRNAAGLSSADQASPLPFEVRLDGERYTALTVPTAPGARLVALTLQSRDQALAPYRLIQGGLLVLGFVAIVAGIGGSAMLARSITRPVARLVEGTQRGRVRAATTSSWPWIETTSWATWRRRSTR